MEFLPIPPVEILSIFRQTFKFCFKQCYALIFFSCFISCHSFNMWGLVQVIRVLASGPWYFSLSVRFQDFKVMVYMLKFGEIPWTKEGSRLEADVRFLDC